MLVKVAVEVGAVCLEGIAANHHMGASQNRLWQCAIQIGRLLNRRTCEGFAAARSAARPPNA